MDNKYIENEYKDAIMHCTPDLLLDESSILEEDIYDLLSSMIAASTKKDKAIEISSKIITNINKLDDIISELVTRIELITENSKEHTSNNLEEGRSKLEKFKLADASDGPITEEFTCDELIDLFSDTVEEESIETENGTDDFNKLIKNFIGGKMECD